MVLKKMLGASPCLNVIYKLHRESAGNPPLSDRIGQRCFRRVDVRATGQSDEGQDRGPDRSPFSGKLRRLQGAGQRLVRAADRLGAGPSSLLRARGHSLRVAASQPHPEAAESLAQPRTPSEGSVHSHGSVAQANCIDPSAHKERGPQDDSAGRAATGKGHHETQSERIPRRSHNS